MSIETQTIDREVLEQIADEYFNCSCENCCNIVLDNGWYEPEPAQELDLNAPSRIVVWDQMRLRVWDSQRFWVILETCPVCSSEMYHGYPCPVCPPPKRRIEINQIIPVPKDEPDKTIEKKKKVKEVETKEYKPLERRKRLLEKWQMPQKEGFVYLAVSENGCHKIGITTDIERRLNEIRKQFPLKINMRHYIVSNDYRELERYLHKKFADKRLEYEWFKLTDADISWFMSLNDYDLDSEL